MPEPQAFSPSDLYGKKSVISGYPFILEDKNAKRKIGDNYMY